jgi:segregation and condensation protein B
MSETNTIDFKFHWDFEKGIFEQPENIAYLLDKAVDAEATAADFEMELDYFDEKEQEDKLWMARTGLTDDTLCGAVETIIFMSERPVALAKIKNQIDEDIPLRVIHEAITNLQAEYEVKHHGIRLQEVAQGYQFRTKATYSKFVQRLFKVSAVVLSPTALEVLSMIAYKQPVSRITIEGIRGVDSSHIIRGLMDKRLVKVTGRSEEVGRPSTYGTTTEFLEVFNLADLSMLPPEYELDEIASGNAFGKISDIKSIVSVGDKSKFDFDEMAELEELSASIKDISSDTIFTKTLNSENKKRNTAEEPTIKRSAFDILEDFVTQDETVKQNKLACVSETPMNVIEARIVDLIKEEGLINAPEIDEDYLDSLDEKIEELATKTEEALGAHALVELEELEVLAQEEVQESEDSEKLEAITELVKELSTEDDTEVVEDLFGGDEKLALEAKALEVALDAAFDNLMGTSTDFSEMKDDEAQENIDQNMQSLDETMAEMTEKAKDMDIDLDFLQSEPNDSDELLDNIDN